jgi:hypothetical protein
MQNQEPVNKVDRNKIYFLVIVIMALLGINAYLYFKNKQESSKFVTVNTEKDRLKLEVEKIEVELDKANALNLNLSTQLQEDQELARKKIAALKLTLEKGELTKADLEKAQKKIKELIEFVNNYNIKIAILEKENKFLRTERDSLKTSADKYSIKAESLEKENQNLNSQVKIGAALKASNIDIKAYKSKNSGKNILVNKASSANKIIINFTIVSNALAEKNYHKVFLRVFDPAGNLVAEDDNMFEIENEQMQYSSAIEFMYNADNSTYSIDWTSPTPFIKGKYVMLLYADGYVMGKGEIVLK